MLLSRQTLALRSALTSPVYRFLSSLPEKDAPAPAPRFAVQHLIQSCGIPSDKAVKASRYLSHLKSSENPDSVLRFLREVGVAEDRINAAALRDPSFLCYGVEDCFRPRMSELRELGFSPSDTSRLLSTWPAAFGDANLRHKIRFWLGFFSSVEKLLCALKSSFLILSVNLENTVLANLEYLREQCDLPAREISHLVSKSPSSITCKPEIFKMRVRRAQELGFSCRSGMFAYGLGMVSRLNESSVDGKLRYLKSLGFSDEDVTVLITNCPSLLGLTEKLIGQKMEFLLKEAGCAQIDVVRNPSILTHSMERRLVPRCLVRKLLKSRGIPAGNNAFVTFLRGNDQQFLKKFVLPYEDTVPGLYQAYADACNTSTTAAG